MMDRQLNKGSSKIAFAVHASAPALGQCKDYSFTVPGTSADEHKVCAVDCIHIRQTVPFGGYSPGSSRGR